MLTVSLKPILKIKIVVKERYPDKKRTDAHTCCICKPHHIGQLLSRSEGDDPTGIPDETSHILRVLHHGSYPATLPQPFPPSLFNGIPCVQWSLSLPPFLLTRVWSLFSCALLGLDGGKTGKRRYLGMSTCHGICLETG